MKLVHFLFLFFLTFSYKSSAQSFVGLNVGIDYAKIEEFNIRPNVINLEIFKNGYGINSWTYGVQGEQKLSNFFSLALFFSYTKKDFRAFTPNIVAVEGLRFNFYRSSALLRYYLSKNIFVGSGILFNYIGNVEVYLPNGTVNSFPINNKREIGGVISTGYVYKKFIIEIYFNKGFMFKEETDVVDFKPINSFGFSLGYLLRVSKKKR